MLVSTIIVLVWGCGSGNPIRQPTKAVEASLSVLGMKLKYCFDCISMMFSNMLFCQKDRGVRLNGALFLGM